MAEVIKTHKCPICHKVVVENRYKPFCSKRCADVDLGRWLDGSYAVPAQELDERDYEELEKSLQKPECVESED
ncbi:MAG: DNA gyrase inhibitor YacG [Alphaproteobacteria bacterium]|nr:DNA gyrase inhibitor YacG [Alphaproteobacteria bacterium]